MPTLLLTGFEPYATTAINPAEQVALALDRSRIENIDIIATIVPNSFYQSIDHVKTHMLGKAIDYVLMMGEYGGRSMVTLERYAHRIIDSSRYQLCDNQDVSYDNKATFDEGPCAYQTQFPIKAMVESMRSAGIPADVSDTAGTFVCNHLFYGILHEIKTQNLATKAGWAHLPMLPSTATQPENLGKPSMSLETLTQAITAAITALAHHPTDIQQSLAAGLQI